jgi:hypothetical protein
MSVAFLLVTCCLEQSRAEVLAQVIRSLQEQAPELHETLTVFDNASIVAGVTDVLRDCYTHVYRADRNVGYWSAIDWWLDHLADDPPTYTYIIESDMVHYAFNKLWTCAAYLDRHPEVGSVRLHQYDVANRHLYDKDSPRRDSKRNLWQSHRNRVTGQPITFGEAEDGVYPTNFLTQLPALNRYQTMRGVLKVLNPTKTSIDHVFSELDFQKLYWHDYQQTGILDGGIFHCDLNPYDKHTLTGSWSSPEELRQVGYQPTRRAKIVPQNEYTVTRL